MFFFTPSQSVSHKWFYQCVNHRKNLSLMHPLPAFGSFRFFQASLWLRVKKVLETLTKSYKSEIRHLCQCCILFPWKCRRKTSFQHTVPPPLYPQFRLSWLHIIIQMKWLVSSRYNVTFYVCYFFSLPINDNLWHGNFCCKQMFYGIVRVWNWT